LRSTRALRDLTTFLLGAAGFVHEVLLVQTERPFLLTASLALMGFPFVLGADTWRRGQSSPSAAPKEAEPDERWSHLP
jgi:hypothetical protein